jgi:hypothetical protein
LLEDGDVDDLRYFAAFFGAAALRTHSRRPHLP